MGIGFSSDSCKGLKKQVPLEVCNFYRGKFVHKITEIVARFHFRKQINVSYGPIEYLYGALFSHSQLELPIGSKIGRLLRGDNK